MKSKLAMLGGPKSFKGKLHSSVVIDKKEYELVKEVLDSRQFSRFMGGGNIKDQVNLTSKEARDIGDDSYFSFLGGKMIRQFESDLSDFFGVNFSVTANSATSALSMAFGALSIGPGDEIITPSMSWTSSSTSILTFNSIPVFVDVCPKTFCIDPKNIERAITERTKAILVVHLLGRSADMDSIMKIAKKHKLKVIEDCAQSPGTMYKKKLVGTIGDVGILSLQETKNFQTGEGGVVITNNVDVARRCRLIRNHGEVYPDDSTSKEELVNLIGHNFRMTELTAAIGIAQLKKLNKNNSIRKKNSDYLSKGLEDLKGLKPHKFKSLEVPHILSFSYSEKVVGVPRSVIISAIQAEGVPVGSGYSRLMSENILYTKKIAYGGQGSPWTDISKNYQPPEFDQPIAKRLTYEEFIWFYAINRPNGIKEMDKVIKTFWKIWDNLDDLVDISEDKITQRYKW